MKMNLSEYLRGQLKEAFGPENKWYCSQYFGYEVTDRQALLEYYIRHGGSQHFASEHLQQLELCQA